MRKMLLIIFVIFSSICYANVYEDTIEFKSFDNTIIYNLPINGFIFTEKFINLFDINHIVESKLVILLNKNINYTYKDIYNNDQIFYILEFKFDKDHIYRFYINHKNILKLANAKEKFISHSEDAKKNNDTIEKIILQLDNIIYSKNDYSYKDTTDLLFILRNEDDKSSLLLKATSKILNFSKVFLYSDEILFIYNKNYIKSIEFFDTFSEDNIKNQIQK